MCDKRKYIFEFEDGSRTVIEAESIVEAIKIKVDRYGDTPWTISINDADKESNNGK
jgi:predicted homoserine dehydrogenase-like protein